MKARIIIGANYGDEGKGIITARYTKASNGTVLNVLTNGGAQRGHTVKFGDLEVTSKHTGSGTIFGADNYFPETYILCPMQYTTETGHLFIDLGISRPCFYRHPNCLWSTPWDIMAGQIINKGKYRSCGMGIWETMQRSRTLGYFQFTKFMLLDDIEKLKYLQEIKTYYLGRIGNSIPAEYYDAWNSTTTILHFLEDCDFLYNTSVEKERPWEGYSEIILESGQGLLLGDTGIDDPTKTPSITGSSLPLHILEGIPDCDISIHYITRPYLTRHGFGELEEGEEKNLTTGLKQDSNIYNEFQGQFRYGKLDLEKLKDRIFSDSGNFKPVIEVTHCDEIDRETEFKKVFNGCTVNLYDSPYIS